MAATLDFVGGDEVVETFLLEHSDGEILDLTGLSVSGTVRWRGRVRIALTIGAEIEIQNPIPARAVEPAVQEPHGFLRLTEIQTAQIPYGAVARLRLKAVEAGVTMSTFDYVLERLP